jgi:signal peptidase II
MLRTALTRVLLLTLIALPCVGCDRLTKVLAREHLAARAPASWFHDVFRLQYAENKGAFLSAGSQLGEAVRRRLLLGGTAMLLTAVAGYLLLAPGLSLPVIAGFSLIIAGGVGNLWDRMTNAGTVIDFLNVGVGPWRTGIFNIADVFLTVGVLIVLLADGRRRRSPD